jgi:hypothetical protein
MTRVRSTALIRNARRCKGRKVITAHDIARWRLESQHLVAPYAASASAVVSGLLAVQAENASQAAWAVACRTRHPDAADLAGLLATGEVLRTHVLRPTWHFVSAVDAAWLLELTAPRVRPVVARQLTEVHGLDEAAVERATSTVLDTLRETPDRTRDELAEALRERGFDITGQRLMLLLARAELDRLVCSGRPREATHTYARFVDRVRNPVRLDREEALGELALRYFTGHGPATERDLAYWATLTVTDVRRGLAVAQDRLESFEHDGRTFWHAPGGAPPSGRPEPAGHLLQILDEMYRGYQDSRMVLDVAGAVPTGRETAIGIALVDAQMVASMKRTVGRRVVFDVVPYRRELAPGEPEALEETARRYGAFLGLEHELVVRPAG